MNITNRIENVLIAIGSAIIAIVLTIVIMHFTSIATLKKEIARQDVRMEKQDAVIVELAKIEKYKIENKFDQIKAKDGQIVMSIDNKLSALTLDSIKNKPPASEKKGFFRKLKFW